MKVSEIIQRVESALVNGLPINMRGAYISHRWIYSVLMSMRHKILEQKSNKKQNISSWDKQTLKCIPLITVSAEECECYLLSGCTIKRTQDKIPDIITNISGYMLDSVFYYNNKIDIISRSEAKYKSYSRFTKNKPSAYIHDGYVYVLDADMLDYINITACFEDPIKVEKMNMENSCDGEANDDCCYNIYDFEFPLDSNLSDVCVMMTIQEISMSFLKGNNQQKEEQEEEQQQTEE